VAKLSETINLDEIAVGLKHKLAESLRGASGETPPAQTAELHERHI
jgi:hypothetical protein